MVTLEICKHSDQDYGIRGAQGMLSMGYYWSKDGMSRDEAIAWAIDMKKTEPCYRNAVICREMEQSLCDRFGERFDHEVEAHRLNTQ